MVPPILKKFCIKPQIFHYWYVPNFFGIKRENSGMKVIINKSNKSRISIGYDSFNASKKAL